jgi:hypothetical protein
LFQTKRKRNVDPYSHSLQFDGYAFSFRFPAITLATIVRTGSLAQRLNENHLLEESIAACDHMTTTHISFWGLAYDLIRLTEAGRDLYWLLSV